MVKKINLKELNKKIYKEVDKYDLSKIVCLDEISVSVQMKPNYSRCELGKRCVQKQPIIMYLRNILY